MSSSKKISSAVAQSWLNMNMLLYYAAHCTWLELFSLEYRVMCCRMKLSQGKIILFVSMSKSRNPITQTTLSHVQK